MVNFDISEVDFNEKEFKSYLPKINNSLKDIEKLSKKMLEYEDPIIIPNDLIFID